MVQAQRNDDDGQRLCDARRPDACHREIKAADPPTKSRAGSDRVRTGAHHVQLVGSALAQDVLPITPPDPKSKFPLIRDLWVDRSIMFDYLKRAKSWVPVDGTYNLSPGPRISAKVHQSAQAFPPMRDLRLLHGGVPAGHRQVFLVGQHPTSTMNQDERLEALMSIGGLMGRGNSQNCN